MRAAQAASPDSEVDLLTERAVGKAFKRLLPVLLCLYIVAYLDRANVAYAKTSMSVDLGFSETVFGFGAGIFFVGYFLLEIPGALIAERWSARLWISRILLTWGSLAVAEGFVQTASQFYTVRFFLGLAEAGFFPAAIIYLSHWFPSRTRAKALSGFILAVPLTFVIAAPISAWCLSIDWLGWPSWRWLFVLQGAPAILFGLVVPFCLPDRPRDARWLTKEDREALERKIEEEREQRRKAKAFRVVDALRHPAVWQLSGALFLVVVGSYGFILWLPARLQRMSGAGTIEATLLSGLPFILGVAGVWWMGRWSDRRQERCWHTAIPLLTCAVSFALTMIPGQPFLLYLMWSCITGLALFAWAPAFWSTPTLLLGESAAATSVGLISSIGNLGGFFGPWLVGWLESGGPGRAEAVLALTFAIAAGVIVSLRRTLATESRD
jgi:sugar phosphate permease